MNSPWWEYVIQAIVAGLAVGWFNWKTGRIKAAIDDNTAKTEEVKVTARATYETVNGNGLLGWARKHEAEDTARHVENVARLERIEAALLGEKPKGQP